MPMIRTKQGDIIVIVQEIQNTHAVRYNINGIDLSRAKYLYIEKQNTSIEIPLGEYSIIIEGNDQYLQVDLGGVADTNAEIYQIIYEQTLDSSQYNPVGDADVDTLTLKYNEAQTDLAELWDAVAKTSMKLDVSTQAQTLPLLGDGEAWYWDETEGQYKGIEIANVEINVDKVNEAGDFQVARITALGDQYITDMTVLRNDTETFRNEAYQFSLDAQASADSIATNARFRQYKTLAELGLTSPVTTQQVINAMTDDSMLIMLVSLSENIISDVPVSAGTLIIHRITEGRLVIEYTDNHNGSFEGKWIGSSYNGTWNGWTPLDGSIKETIVLRADGNGKKLYAKIYYDNTVIIYCDAYYLPNFTTNALPSPINSLIPCGSVTSTSNSSGGGFLDKFTHFVIDGTTWRFFKLAGSGDYMIRASVSTKIN